MARAYRWLEYLSFGWWLSRCRYAQLRHLTGAHRALLLGDGDGRFLARLLKVNPALRADVVDSSHRMLSLLAKRIRTFDRAEIHLHHADFLSWEPRGEYDLIVSHFFLDCFFPQQVDQVVGVVIAHAKPEARWVVSEFAVPANAIAGLLARAIIALLYRAFGWLTGLRVRAMPNYPAVMRRHSFMLSHQRGFLGGLLRSEIWTLPTASKMD